MIDNAITLIETEKVRIRVVYLAPNAFNNTHFHTFVSEQVICLEGTVAVHADTLGLEAILVPGQSVTIRKGIPHRISNMAEHPAQYVLTQSGGEYDHFELTK